MAGGRFCRSSRAKRTTPCALVGVTVPIAESLAGPILGASRRRGSSGGANTSLALGPRFRGDDDQERFHVNGMRSGVRSGS
jgi:hypothetical protein